MKKVKVATVWLDGCSGCHMSLLDMDAAIISLAQKIDLVYGPLLQRVYVDGAQENKVVPTDGLPPLLKHARPLREFVKVDICLPGCPPPAKTITKVMLDLVEARKRDANVAVKFG